jgi:hypothetical protein
MVHFGKPFDRRQQPFVGVTLYRTSVPLWPEYN